MRNRVYIYIRNLQSHVRISVAFKIDTSKICGIVLHRTEGPLTGIDQARLNQMNVFFFWI